MSEHRWPGSLHGGQLVILMIAVSLLGYTVMSGAAMLIWNAWNRAFGLKPSGEYWAVFLGGIALILVAHLMGRSWAARRKLWAPVSLLLALWSPAVFGLWAYRSFNGANDQSVAFEKAHSSEFIPFDTIPGGLAQQRMALQSVSGQFAFLFFASGVVATVLLFMWFGGRRPEVDLPSSAEMRMSNMRGLPADEILAEEKEEAE